MELMTTVMMLATVDARSLQGVEGGEEDAKVSPSFLALLTCPSTGRDTCRMGVGWRCRVLEWTRYVLWCLR